MAPTESHNMLLVFEQDLWTSIMYHKWLANHHQNVSKWCGAIKMFLALTLVSLAIAQHTAEHVGPTSKYALVGCALAFIVCALIDGFKRSEKVSLHQMYVDWYVRLAQDLVKIQGLSAYEQPDGELNIARENELSHIRLAYADMVDEEPKRLHVLEELSFRRALWRLGRSYMITDQPPPPLWRRILAPIGDFGYIRPIRTYQ